MMDHKMDQKLPMLHEIQSKLQSSSFLKIYTQSRVLFNIYVHQQTEIFRNINIRIQYADNIAIYYTYEKREIATKDVQIGIKPLKNSAINGKHSSTRGTTFKLSFLDKH